MEFNIDSLILSTKSIQTVYGEQDENGTDLSLIRWLLRLSPVERVRMADGARREVLKMREHVRREPRSGDLVD
jgi:hypothetical protein